MEEEGIPKKERRAEYKKSILSFALHTLGRGEIYETKEMQSLFQQNILQYYILSFYLLLLMIWGFSILIIFKGTMKLSLRSRLLSRGLTETKEKIASLLALMISVTSIAFIVSIPIMVWIGDSSILVNSIVGLPLIILVFALFFLLLEVLVRNERMYLWLGMVVIIIGALAGGHFIPSVYFPRWLELAGAFTINSWALELTLFMFAENSKMIPLDSIKGLGAIAAGLAVTLYLVLRINRRREW